MQRQSQATRAAVLHAEHGRRFPIGAETLDGRISFRLWAPAHDKVEIAIEQPEPQTIDMIAEEGGYFGATIDEPDEPVRYRFRLDGRDRLLPDPASRFQPEGPHGPSEVIDPTRFPWTDAPWPGLGLENRIIYEMHIGTFTPEGTWRAAAKQFPELVEAGVDLIEMMPIAEFPGRFGWGYDGVNLFAPTRLYGRPDDLRSFVDAAHGLGLGVILDVVYNHFGPDGNHLKTFSPSYFTDRYKCEWGDAINFDGPDSAPVREFFITNARYWIEEFHFDGFRLDATQQIFDSTQPGIIAEIVRNARQAAGSRQIVMIGENEPQRIELLDPIDRGGSGLDGLWNDDLHHAMRVALTGRSEAYFSDYRGSPQEIISAARHGFLYQGQRSCWQSKPRGTPSFGVDRCRLIGYIENHDQIANSAWGTRLIELVAPGRYRAAMTLLMLGPWTPLIFQGQEFGASTPFLYFADHKPDMARFIAKGRREFLSQFSSIADGVMMQFLAEPGREDTFAQSRLNPRERQRNFRFYNLFKDLVALRRTDEVFSLCGKERIEGAVLSDRAFVLRFFGPGMDRLLLINFGFDLRLAPAPEPLMAPPHGQGWHMILSTEDPQYGGSGIAKVPLDDGWRIPAETATVLASRP
ncbi:MAG: malto-oligosyltrehalose trehalohydrolase [Phycisphaerales bacterium]